jgi:predicted neutral ceramidase superfamily lipid hydrolase
MFEHEFSTQFPLQWKYYALLYMAITLMIMSSSLTIKRYLRAAVRELNSYILSFVPAVLLIYTLYFVTKLH